jgi:hypothetical protein
MELGHLQLFVSLTLMVVTALIALAFDFFKRNNEQLRELTVELRVRREEEQRRLQPTVKRPEPVAPVLEPPQAVVAPPPPPPLAAPKERTVSDKPRSERKRTVNAEALAAMERGALLASTGGRPKAPVDSIPVQVEVAQPPAPVVATPSSARKDWGSILSRKPQVTAPAMLPLGFQDGYVLNKLVQAHQPISGLVVSIGVNASRNADGTLPEAVHQVVQSLIGPNDFAAQSSEDEFLLIYPQEKGASAQRRLSRIAQQLWDFQLRSLGTFQILFSWGGVEVSSESIDEAIASASGRMQETKRGRKLITMASPTAQSGSPLAKAV